MSEWSNMTSFIIWPHTNIGRNNLVLPKYWLQGLGPTIHMQTYAHAWSTSSVWPRAHDTTFVLCKLQFATWEHNLSCFNFDTFNKPKQTPRHLTSKNFFECSTCLFEHPRRALDIGVTSERCWTPTFERHRILVENENQVDVNLKRWINGEYLLEIKIGLTSKVNVGLTSACAVHTQLGELTSKHHFECSTCLFEHLTYS